MGLQNRVVVKWEGVRIGGWSEWASGGVVGTCRELHD